MMQSPTRTTKAGSRTARLALLLSLFVLWGCSAGGDGGQSTDETTSERAGTEETDEPEAQEETASLDGETVNLIAPYGPGGSYDRILRAISDHVAQASGATVVVLNEPGAGGLVGTNNTFVAREDDLRVALVNTAGIVSAELGEADGVNFELGEFNWIGSVTSDPETLVVPPDGRFSSVQEMIEGATEADPVRLGAPGPGDSQYVNALLLRNAFDVPIEIITGFSGAPDVYAAVMRGDVDGAIGSLTSTLPNIEGGELVPLAYMGSLPDQLEEASTPEAVALLRDAPALGELAEELGADEEGRELIALHESVLQIGRALAAPPSTPEDRVAAYRDAFEEAATDQAFLDAALEQGIFITWRPAEEVERVMADILAAPDAYVQLMVDAYSAG